ncbi:MAG TPA: DNA damage-inducible protein D [Ktedonobacterales bacterium]|nr:DNA damage-inducible protein D [Ktedonobacterales bacterium]
MTDDTQRQFVHVSPFESIRQTNEHGSAYWSARDLSKILDYTNWRNFRSAIEKAITACVNSGQDPDDHFATATKISRRAKSATSEIEDFHLSRYACYLVVQNADPSKEIVALGQTYFTIRTRRDELAQQREENLRRMDERDKVTHYNRDLSGAADGSGLTTQREFAVFYDFGYMGLYNGERAKDVAARKGLKRGQHILDYMSSTELAANGLRAALTAEKLRNDNIQGASAANQTHFQVGRIVRNAVIEAGALPPERQPTPEKSIQQVRREEQQRLVQGAQLSLFNAEDGE